MIGRRRGAASLLLAGLVCILFLTGCWNRRELNELAVVLAMGIDSIDGQYEVSVQIVDPSQMSRNRSAERSPVVTLAEKAPSIFEALRKITTKTSRKMYIAHIRMLLFDEETARQGIKEELDFLLRDHEVRPDFYIAIARDCAAKQLLQLVTPTEVLPAVDLYRSLQVSEKVWAPTAAVKVTDLLQRFSQSGIDPVLTGVTIKGDWKKGAKADNVKQPVSNAEFTYTGIGMLKNGRLVGWMNESDSKAFTYINNQVSSTVGRIACPQSKGEFAVEVTSSKISVEPSIKEGRPHIALKGVIEGNINEVQCEADLTDEKQFGEMEVAARASLVQVLQSGIHRAQKFGVDIFGFGGTFHRKYPKQWHEWEKEWNVMFKELAVEISLEEYHLRRVGKIISPFDYNPINEE